MINTSEVDVKGAMTLALKSLVGQKIYVENIIMKVSYQQGSIHFISENPAQAHDPSAVPYLLLAEIDAPSWSKEYASTTPCCSEDELYEKVSALSRTFFQSKEWDKLLAKYRAAFDPEDFEFEVGFEMDGFPDEQVYLLEMEEEEEDEDDEDDEEGDYGNYGGAQSMAAMYGQMDEQTRAAYLLQAQQAQQSMQATMAQMGIAMPQIPGMDMAAMMQQAQANLQANMTQMSPEMMANYGAEGMDDDDDEQDSSLWEVRLAPKSKSLSNEQGSLLAFGAPMYVYRHEFANTLNSGADKNTLKQGLSEWWEITDHQSAIDLLNWLLNEGHREQVDPLIDLIDRLPWNECRGYLLKQFENEDDAQELISKYYAVKKMKRAILKQGTFEDKDIPKTVAAWDYVRAVSVARWCLECGYITTEEFWTLAQQVKDAVDKGSFSSWVEYGISFSFGRGVWQGSEVDLQVGMQITEALITATGSPWLQYKW